MVNKSCRPRGRPRRFEESDALDQAAKVFWAKGYDGATLDDLVAAAGVSRPSLYATFGDKESLFMRCIERYSEQVGKAAACALGSGESIRASIASFLKRGVENATGAGTPAGCLLANVAPLVADESVKAFTARAQEQADRMIQRRLDEAVRAGELPVDFPCAARARQIVSATMALAIRSRVGESRAALLADADEAVALIFGSASSA